jgi:predicted lipid-binding transport protein (Tim44 family)
MSNELIDSEARAKDRQATRAALVYLFIVSIVLICGAVIIWSTSFLMGVLMFGVAGFSIFLILIGLFGRTSDSKD